MPKQTTHRRTVRLSVCLILGLLTLPFIVHTLLAIAPSAGSYAVLTSSMEPTIDAGDLVYTYEADEYAPGDVITYRHEGALVTHRVVAVNSAGYQTQGDANDAPDGYTVPPDAVVGKVILTIPVVGRIIAGHMAVYLIALLIGGCSFKSLYSDLRQPTGEV